MSHPTELRPGDVVADRYVVESLLGVSPAGRSYLADENHSRQKLCLKVYDRDLSARFASSSDFFLRAGTLAALQHDNLAAVYDVQEWEGFVFVAREYLDGPDFERFAAEGGSWTRGMEWIWQAAQCLGTLHEKACHLNIHPGNLLVSGFTAKLADPDPRLLSGSEHIPFSLPWRPGALGYVAPEMRRGGSLAFAASDFYGLAGLLFRLVVGAPPSEQARENQRRLAELDPEIAAFLAKALHPEPAQRFSSAESFSDALWGLQPALQRQQQKSGSGTWVDPEPGASAGKNESVSAGPAGSGTLFGSVPAGDFSDPIPASPPPATRKPLSSLEAAPEEGAVTFFGTPKTTAAPKAPPPSPPRPLFSAPVPPPVPPPEPRPGPRQSPAFSLTSLELDSPDVTLSGAGSSGMTRYGFQNAQANQTLALEAKRRRKTLMTLLLSATGAALALAAFTALFFYLRNSAVEPAASMPPAAPAAEEPPAAEAPASPAATAPAPEPAPSPPFPEVAEAPPEPSRPAPATAPPAADPAPAKTRAASAKPAQEELVRRVQSQQWPPTAAERLQIADWLNDYGRTAEANMAYSKGMEAGPTQRERIRALGGLAVTFDKMGMKEEALSALDQLLALQPDNRFARNLRAKLRN